MAKGPLRAVSNDEVRRLVSMAAAVEVVREAFRDLAAGAFDLPPRLVFGGKVLVMSAHHIPTGSAVVKTLSVELGRAPAVIGSVLWTDAVGQFTVDAEAVTTLRTGAVVGVATDALADRNASTLTIIGSGHQAADQVRGVQAVRPLSELVVYSREVRRSERLLELLAPELPGVRLRTATTVESALAASEIVCCATSSILPLFQLDALPERVHINAIGSFRPTMRELPVELLATASRVIVDQVWAATTEAGEIVHALACGAIVPSDLYELSAVLDDPQVPTGRTVFKSVGIAIQDWAIASLLTGGLPRATAPAGRDGAVMDGGRA